MLRNASSALTPDHPDHRLLAALRDEIEQKAGGPAALQARFPLLARDAIDFVLDPVRTARTKLTDLDKVEKTFIGLKLEHFIRDMLDAPKGVRDLMIAGHDVDIKNTVGSNWSIPVETYRSSEPCLLTMINDTTGRCSLGLILARPEYLHGGAGNRDTKKGVSSHGLRHILWIERDRPFPPSRFAGIDMARFRDLRRDLTGNERAAQFFRENIGRKIHRPVAEALLFDQYDYMKRLRANGGAPDILRRESIAILIGTYTADRRLAARHGIDSLRSDEIVSVRTIAG